MTVKAARRLRQNPTEAEKCLWALLRRRQIVDHRFRRQEPIGPYVVDFVCFEAKLVIEVAGGQHALQGDGDAKRGRWLECQGFRILRFWNNDVLSNRTGVAEQIATALRAPPTPTLPHKGNYILD